MSHYLVVTEIRTREGMEARYLELLRGVVDALAKAPCFIDFTISRSAGDFRQVLLHELWTSRAEYELLRDSPAFRHYLEHRDELVASVNRKDWMLLEHTTARFSRTEVLVNPKAGSDK